MRLERNVGMVTPSHPTVPVPLDLSGDTSPGVTHGLFRAPPCARLALQVGDLVCAASDYKTSRFRFGETLAAYKAFFAEEQGWMTAVKTIGQAIGHDERTVRRILEDYVLASQLPAGAIRELESLGIDPAAKKNAPIIDNLLTMDGACVELAPQAAVTTAVKVVAAEKAAAKKAKATTPSKPTHECGTTLLVLPTPEEKQRRDIRLAIRAALVSVPDDKKLAELKSALEEEMFEVWGEREPSIVTFTPCPSSQTAGVQQEQERAA